MVDRPTRALLSGASLRCSAARCDRWWQSIWHAPLPTFPLIAACVAAALALLSRRRIAPPVPRLDTGKEQEGQAPRRLRKAETILRRRTSRLLLVLEGSYDLHNKAAVCRTADCLGIQNVWMVNSRTVGDGREGRGKTVGRERRGVGEGLEDEQAAPQETPPTEAESVESRAERKADWVEERVSGREAAKRKPPRKTQRARKEAEIRMAKQAEMCAQLARLCPGEEPSYEGATASLGGSSPPSLSGKITKQAEEWLSIRQFASTAECLAALRAERYEIWATVLSQDAIELDSPSLRVPCAPTRLAIVFGSEVVGVSAQMVNAAHRRVYFPIHGFSESLNLSVSAALIMQTILQKDPSLRGCMNDMERASLRREWFLRLAKSPEHHKTYPTWAISRPPEPFDDLRRCDHIRAQHDKRIPPKTRRKLGASFVQAF